MVLVLFACSCRVIFLEGIDWVRYRLEGQKGPCFWGTLCASRHHSRGSTKLSTSSACADWDGKEEVGKGHWAPWVHKEHSLFPLGITGVASSKSLPARKCCIGKVAYESDFCSSPLIPLSLKLSFWSFVEKKHGAFSNFFFSVQKYSRLFRGTCTGHVSSRTSKSVLTWDFLKKCLRIEPGKIKATLKV